MSHFKLSKVAIVVSLLVMLFALSGISQAAQVFGTVTRSNGRALSGADIILGSATTGVKADGRFSFDDIANGTYDLTVKMGSEVLYTTKVTVANTPVSVPAIVATPADEVIYAQDFEIMDGGRPFGWTNFSARTGTGGAYATDKSYEGNTSWLLTGTGNHLDGIRLIYLPAVPGKAYVASFQYFAVEAGCTLYLDFLDKDGKRVEAPRAIAPVTDGWAEFSVAGSAPAGTAYVAPFFYYPPTTKGQTYIDNVTVIEF